MTPAARFAYVGTYTRGAPGGDSGAKSEGLYVLRVDPASGALTVIQRVRSDNPSFVCLHPSQRTLYCALETDDFDGKKQGGLEAWRIDPESGMLTLINRTGSGGHWPCDLNVDASGRHLVAANYGGGNYVVVPIADDGSLGPLSDLHQNLGMGPNAARQEAAHPHCVEFDPARRFIATADLGIDKVQIFGLDAAAGRLDLVSEAAVAPGAGPRHIAFHPGGGWLYVINELNGTITGFGYAGGRVGAEIQTIDTVAPDFPGQKNTGEIKVHPSGRFLYGSNRRSADHPQADSIVAYSIDPASGRLTLIEHVTGNVAYPRHFNLDPSGAWLYVNNQKGDSIVQFTIDARSGRLTETGRIADVPIPVSMVFRTT